MSQDRGKRLPRDVAAYLARWWPHAEATPGGRNGTDILGTPGVVWEIKTAAKFSPSAFCKQAARHACNGEIHPVVYLPPGVGARSVGQSLAILPLEDLMYLLVSSGYAPAPDLFEESALWDMYTLRHSRGCGRSGFTIRKAHGTRRATTTAGKARASA